MFTIDSKNNIRIVKGDTIIGTLVYKRGKELGYW